MDIELKMDRNQENFFWIEWKNTEKGDRSRIMISNQKAIALLRKERRSL